MDPMQYFTNLALAAMIDGELHENERILLEKHAENLRLTSEQAQSVLNGVFSGKLTKFMKPESPEARKAAFRAVVRILRADKKLTRVEQRMIRVIGRSMNISNEMVASALLSKWNPNA